ncbi:MAG TPA: threonine synthase, partial [Psychrobacter sp.]|nr:threonine synthase [Psychrobacter sp.]
SYPQLAMAIMQRFATDIPAADLQDIIERTYTSEVFGSDEIVPVRKLEDNLYILGLSNGPTLAFKDVAMQFLGNAF